MTEVTIMQEARVEAMHFDWCDATDTEIIAEVSWLEPLVSPNRNACLIQEMRRRFEVRTLTPAQAAGPVLLEALKLADAALRGANMNMTVVERKISEAITQAEGPQA